MLTVVLETGTVGVCLRADRTLERPLSGMFAKMSCKVTLLDECHRAPVTLVRPLTGVDANVVC